MTIADIFSVDVAWLLFDSGMTPRQSFVAGFAWWFAVRSLLLCGTMVVRAVYRHVTR